MKKQKLFVMVNALVIFCIPLALLLIDTDHFSIADMTGARSTEYTIRLDSTNTPEFLSEEPLPTNSWLIATPSRSVGWLYETGTRTYPNAHLAMTDLASVRSFSTTDTLPITGVLSITIDWAVLNGLMASDISMYIWKMDGEAGPASEHNFNGLTSPHTFTRSDLGDYYSSCKIMLQMQASAGAPNAMFVLNSLEISYDCISCI